jgi:hypothetical protein
VSEVIAHAVMAHGSGGYPDFQPTVFGPLLQNGTPPSEIQAEEVFKEVTPGRGIEDKLPIGIFDSDGTLVSPD